jgi:hypothetical protein
MMALLRACATAKFHDRCVEGVVGFVEKYIGFHRSVQN